MPTQRLPWLLDSLHCPLLPGHSSWSTSWCGHLSACHGLQSAVSGLSSFQQGSEELFPSFLSHGWHTQSSWCWPQVRMGANRWPCHELCRLRHQAFPCTGNCGAAGTVPTLPQLPQSPWLQKSSLWFSGNGFHAFWTIPCILESLLLAQVHKPNNSLTRWWSPESDQKKPQWLWLCLCASSGPVCASSHQKKQTRPAAHQGLALQSSFLHTFPGQVQQPLADENQQLDVPQCTVSSGKTARSSGALEVAYWAGQKNGSVGWIQCHSQQLQRWCVCWCHGRCEQVLSSGMSWSGPGLHYNDCTWQWGGRQNPSAETCLLRRQPGKKITVCHYLRTCQFSFHFFFFCAYIIFAALQLYKPVLMGGGGGATMSVTPDSLEDFFFNPTSIFLKGGGGA